LAFGVRDYVTPVAANSTNQKKKPNVVFTARRHAHVLGTAKCKPVRHDLNAKHHELFFGWVKRTMEKWEYGKSININIQSYRYTSNSAADKFLSVRILTLLRQDVHER
jgi:hypothetical protein